MYPFRKHNTRNGPRQKFFREIGLKKAMPRIGKQGKGYCGMGLNNEKLKILQFFFIESLGHPPKKFIRKYLNKFLSTGHSISGWSSTTTFITFISGIQILKTAFTNRVIQER
jgi:hypothetical protein